ncbi:hypothetical protein ANCCAN_05964 [Ancylostoma caninum]|uniref:Uncharacterized protein n=1 Tax=Ancylostoma caninum TaxID=29170 RepID=A0A368GU63_ANCCA|nr:hypothetical protein ANCCAN_05964 [Ancylostoma caninum]
MHNLPSTYPWKKSALTETKGPIKDEARTEELEQLKQATELKKMKQDFEEGKVASTADEELQQAKAAIAEERQKLTEIGKEKYSKFKDRFENLDSTLEENLEEKLKRLEREMVGVGKETLASAKERILTALILTLIVKISFKYYCCAVQGRDTSSSSS